MRFILNFIFYGVLFYAISLIFPDAFHTLVGWANAIYEFLRDIILQLIEKIQQWRGVKGSSYTAEHAFLLSSLVFASAFKKIKKFLI